MEKMLYNKKWNYANNSEIWSPYKQNTAKLSSKHKSIFYSNRNSKSRTEILRIATLTHEGITDFSQGSYFSNWLCTAFLTQLVAILNQPGNGTSNSGGLTRSCHSQCLLPRALRCQELEGCHGYPLSFCLPPWHTYTKKKNPQNHEWDQLMQLHIITILWKRWFSMC